MEVKKKGIVIGILLLWLLPLIVSGTEYTPSSEINCDKFGKCTLIQYSGTQFLQEDGEWKQYDKARSLLGKGFDIKYIETDENYPMEVLDFNATSVTVNLNPKGIVVFDKEVPLKTWTEPTVISESKSLTGDFKLDYDKAIDTLVDFNLFKQSDVITLDVKMGDIIEFGPNSTTITLQADNTGNLKDTYDDSGSASTNFGTGNALQVGTTTVAVNRSSLISFNISTLPNGVDINNATLILSVSFVGPDAGEAFTSIAFWTYPNYTWTETGETYNNGPRRNINFTDTIFSDIWTLDSTYNAAENVSYNVTSLVAKSYSTLDNNITIRIEPIVVTAGTPIASDAMQFASRDHATASRHPILKIEYTSNLPSSCIYPGSGNWNINTHDNCTINSNVNLGGNNLILNGSGTILMNANITNKGSLVMSSGSKIVLANGAVLG